MDPRDKAILLLVIAILSVPLTVMSQLDNRTLLSLYTRRLHSEEFCCTRSESLGRRQLFVSFDRGRRCVLDWNSLGSMLDRLETAVVTGTLAAKAQVRGKVGSFGRSAQRCFN